MWMHFAIFCSMELEKSNSHRHAEAEIAAFAHPRYKYPRESTHSSILPSSPKGYQSNNVCTGHQQCFFFEGTLAVNPFTNVNRLDVFRNLSSSCGGSQLSSSIRESSSCSPSVSSKCAPTPSSIPVQVSVHTCAATQLTHPFPRNDLRPHFSSKALPILNSHPGICQPLHFDDSITPCKARNQLRISQRKTIEERSMTLQQSNILPATNHPYLNEKASIVSAIGLGCKTTHLNHVAQSNMDHVTSLTGGGVVPNPSFLSHSEQRKTSEWEMGKITGLNAGNRAFDLEEKSPFDMDEELKRSLYDIIDVEENCPFLSISRLSPNEDNIELSYCDLIDNHLSFSPVAGRTSEMKSPLNFDMASPTNISNVGSYSPSSVCSILRGSMKNIESMDFNSCHRRQLHGKQEQLQTQLKQYHTQSERGISDQSSSQSQMWHYNKKAEDSWI